MKRKINCESIGMGVLGILVILLLLLMLVSVACMGYMSFMDWQLEYAVKLANTNVTLNGIWLL